MPKIKNKILVVVESPNKVKKISEYLGPKYLVRASFGHIMDLAGNTKNNKLGIDIKNDFQPKYKILEDKKDKLNSIIDAAGQCNLILLATDPDREGEAIAFHLASCLDSCGVPMKRAVFNEITKKAVQNAVKNPKELNNDLFDAQQARRAIDRIVGFIVSPYLSSFFETKFSAGRVQSVATKLIVDRDKEIESFKPEEYWNINLNIYNKANKLNVKYVGEITNNAQADKIKKDVQQVNFTVDNIDAKEKLKYPLAPLTTSKLQQLASSKFSFPVEKTMKLAQSLYESGHISYMRTDSTRLSEDFLKDSRDWLQNNGYQTPVVPNIYESKNSAQDAHEAIRPTDISRTKDKMFVSDDENKIYNLIWEITAASQLLPAKYDTSKITFGAGKYHFAANGRILKDPGYLKLYNDADNDDIELPNVKLDEMFCVEDDSIKLDQRFTKPPQRYTEGTLVKELEKRNIGRPSTYASIISTIKSRNYVEIKNKTYTATESGKKVTEHLNKYFKFLDYSYTSDMESNLDLIAENKLTYLQVLNDFFNIFQTEMRTAYYDAVGEYNLECSECGDKMILRHGPFGYYMFCISLKCSHSEPAEIVDGKPVLKSKRREPISGLSCDICSREMFRRDGFYGPYYVCMSAPECTGWKPILVSKTCPNCQSPLAVKLINKELKLVCSSKSECSHIEAMTDEARQELKTDWVHPSNFSNSKLPLSLVHKKILQVKPQPVSKKQPQI